MFCLLCFAPCHRLVFSVVSVCFVFLLSAIFVFLAALVVLFFVVWFCFVVCFVGTPFLASTRKEKEKKRKEKKSWGSNDNGGVVRCSDGPWADRDHPRVVVPFDPQDCQLKGGQWDFVCVCV